MTRALIDVVLAITVIETAWFARWRGRWTDGTIANLVAALSLLVALRLVALGAGTAAVGGALAAAGIAHLGWLRLRR